MVAIVYIIGAIMDSVNGNYGFLLSTQIISIPVWLARVI